MAKKKAISEADLMNLAQKLTRLQVRAQECVDDIQRIVDRVIEGKGESKDRDSQ